MVEFMTCFKCWGGKAVLTYEENRVYKVSCECGCEYTFEHCSMKAAQEYHNKMLELYAEIDKNEKLKAENKQLRRKYNAMMAEAAHDASQSCETCTYKEYDTNSKPCSDCLLYNSWQWRGIEETP